MDGFFSIVKTVKHKFFGVSIVYFSDFLEVEHTKRDSRPSLYIYMENILLIENHARNSLFSVYPLTKYTKEDIIFLE
jgi:hypothetical protein